MIGMNFYFAWLDHLQLHVFCTYTHTHTRIAENEAIRRVWWMKLHKIDTTTAHKRICSGFIVTENLICHGGRADYLDRPGQQTMANRVIPLFAVVVGVVSYSSASFIFECCCFFPFSIHSLSLLSPQPQQQ